MERHVVRTNIEQSVLAKQWVIDSLITGTGATLLAWGLHDMGQADAEEGLRPGIVAIVGLVLLAPGLVKLGADAEADLAPPTQRTRVVTSPPGSAHTAVCSEALSPTRTLTIVVPNATLSAPIDAQGAARVAIPDHVWESRGGVVDAVLKINDDELGVVRLVRPVPSE